MRILIVYASKHGATRKIVERMTDVMRESHVEVHLAEVSELPRNLALRVCDVVIVASPVYFGKHHRKIESFVRRYLADLRTVRTVLVSVSGAARAAASLPVARQNVDTFVKRTGWAPDRVELVAGGEPYTRYGILTRWIMVRMSRKMGRVVDPHTDYEFTDWEAVDAFARAVCGAPATAASVELNRR